MNAASAAPMKRSEIWDHVSRKKSLHSAPLYAGYGYAGVDGVPTPERTVDPAAISELVQPPAIREQSRPACDPEIGRRRARPAFDFLEALPDGPPDLTGHADG